VQQWRLSACGGKAWHWVLQSRFWTMPSRNMSGIRPITQHSQIHSPSNLGENKEEEKRYLAAWWHFSDYPVGTSITGEVQNSILSYPCLLQLVLHPYLPIANYIMRDVRGERSMSPITDKWFWCGERIKLSTQCLRVYLIGMNFLTVKKQTTFHSLDILPS
jgi:hypothetical protein